MRGRGGGPRCDYVLDMYAAVQIGRLRGGVLLTMAG